MINHEELAKRLENPSKEFESLLWRPKSKFLRRFKAKYIHYVTIFGYVFLAALLGVTIYVWAWPNPIFVSSDDSIDLLPTVLEVKAPFDGTITNLPVSSGTDVKKGETIVTLKKSDGTDESVSAEMDGTLYWGAENTNKKKSNEQNLVNEDLDDLKKEKKAQKDLLSLGDSVTSGKTFIRIVDFQKLQLKDVKLKKADFDSINIGDSANISIVGNSISKTAIALVLNMDDEKLGGRIGFGHDDGLWKKLEPALLHDSISADGYGTFPVTELKELSVTYIGSAKQSSISSSKQPGQYLYNRKTEHPIQGVVTGGQRVIKVKKIAGFSPDISEIIREHGEKYIATQVIDVEGKPYEMGNSNLKYQVEMDIIGKIPLQEYSRESNKSKSMKSDTKSEAYMEVNIEVLHPQAWVIRQVRQLYELPGSPRLKVTVEVLAYKTTWGKKVADRL